MRHLVLMAVLAGACGRIDFAKLGDGGGDDSAQSACAALGATFCDDFERATPIAAGDPVWQQIECASAGASLVVDGTLAINYPGMTTGFGQCQLYSLAGPSARTVQLDLDVTFQGHAGDGAVVIASPGIELAQPNADGVQSLELQLDVFGDGSAGLAAVFYYPDSARSPIPGSNYPGYNVADSNGATWLVPGAACHVTITGDFSSPSGAATATCNGSTATMTTRGSAAPSGLIGEPTLYLGYSNANSAVQPGALAFDNLILRLAP